MSVIFSVEKFGVLTLGIVVGFLLGFGLMNSRPTLKAVLTVLGAALGGAPILFLGFTPAKWLYPIGLLLGLLWVRVIPARLEVAAYKISKISLPRKDTKVHGLFAWIDLIAIASITVGGLLFTLVGPSMQALVQKDKIPISEINTYEVFYSIPYESIPSLVVKSQSSVSVIEQRPDGFKVNVLELAPSASELEWVAKGVPRAN